MAVLAVGTADAAVLSVPDFSLTPNSTSDSPVQTYDVNTNNGGTIVKNGDPVAYFVTTFTFGTDTRADLQLNFAASLGQDRLGIRVTDNGFASSTGDGSDTSNEFDFDGAGTNSPGTMAGQTVTIIGKFSFDANNSVTYSQSNASNDTFATFWINPTSSAEEGSGLPDGYAGVANANFKGDFASSLWNSSSFFLLEQRIFNNGTLTGSGDSAIVNTTLLTGADATFANALALATIPEPSTLALMGLGGLLIARRRHN